jgi:aryl-alcohol dehydrogenase-like predicted oxidoreductase
MKAAAEWLRDPLDAWEKLCAVIGERPDDVALAWLLANPVVTAPIIGPRTLQQFEESLRAIDITLDAEVLGRLDQIFPGPGGTAPEAYAW